MSLFPNEPVLPLRSAGVDEVGRGPLAGPVYAAAVILDPARPIDGLKDSKLLTAAERERLCTLIEERAFGVAVARAEVEEIDSLNILRASLLAMQRAVSALAVAPEVVYVDGRETPYLPMPVVAIIGGDATVQEISAASIVAKVHRDREMQRLSLECPGYGFDQHKGYATRAHLKSLAELGPSPHHRRSFAPVRESAHDAACAMLEPELFSGADAPGSGLSLGADAPGSGLSSGADAPRSGLSSGADAPRSGLSSGADAPGSGLSSGADAPRSGLSSGADAPRSGLSSGADAPRSGLSE